MSHPSVTRREIIFCTFPCEKVEIASHWSLQDVVEEEFAIAARVMWFRGAPSCQPFSDLLIGNVQMKSPLRYIQLNYVSVLDDRQRPTFCGFWSYVERNGPVRRTAHSGVAESYHVLYPLIE